MRAKVRGLRCDQNYIDSKQFNASLITMERKSCSYMFWKDFMPLKIVAVLKNFHIFKGSKCNFYAQISLALALILNKDFSELVYT